MPRFSHVRLIAAIGNFGQIGDQGKLPWHDPEDLQHFRRVTMGGLCVVGKATAHKLPNLDGRDIYVWQRHDNPIMFANANSHRDVWIIGGATIYRLWMPFVSLSVITHIDHDPKADRYMPWLWRMPTPPKNNDAKQRPINTGNT